MRAVGRSALALAALALSRLALAAQFAAQFAAQEVPAEEITERTLQSNLLAEILILFGCVFILAAALGMLRFPDFYTRLHASTKLVTLGGVGVFGGAAIAFTSVGATGRVFLIASFFFLTAPLSAYMIARSGYLRGLRPYREETSVDEWGACGDAVER